MLDLGTVNNYVQLVIWVFGGVLWLRKIIRNGKAGLKPLNTVGNRLVGCALVIGLLISSASLYYNYRPRIQDAAQQRPRLLLGWGMDGACAEMIDTSQLVKYQEKYKVVTICGILDPTVDKDSDDRITVSSLRTIVGGTMQIITPYSKPMVYAVDKLRKEGIQKFEQWHEIILLPNETQVAEIRMLSDIHRYGGKILSRDPY